LDSSQATGDAQSRDAAVQQLLDRLPSPCGIFSPSDHSAAWLRGRLLNWGWSIPNQFGLIGVGDLALACLSRTPELSSVVIPWQELGYQAVLRLRRLLAGTDIAAPPIITPHFVEARTSTTLVPDTSRLAAKAMRLLKRHLRHDWSIDEIAARLDCPSSTLRRHIHQATGGGLHQWRQQQRIELAKSLLCRRDLSLAEVAKQAGFGTLQTFQRTFRTLVGISPKAYRHHREH
jgi:LacI family transcriptional regulator